MIGATTKSRRIMALRRQQQRCLTTKADDEEKDVDDDGGDDEFVPISVSDEHLARAANADIIRAYAKKETHRVTVRQMFQIGHGAASRLASAQFLHREIPIRLAKRISDLQSLPFGLSNTAQIKEITRLYRKSFAATTAIDTPQTAADEAIFTQSICDILQTHQMHIVKLISEALTEQFFEQHSDPRERFLLQEFLDRFFLSRIGLRMLMSQHVALQRVHTADVVGVIHRKCSPHVELNDAIEQAHQFCVAHYGEAPSVVVGGEIHMTFRYVRDHFRFIVLELLKNAMAATYVFHREQKNVPKTTPLPPIRIVIAKGHEDVIIKISDQAGGVRREDLPLLFTYGYGRDVYAKEHESSSPQQQQQQQQQHEAAATQDSSHNAAFAMHAPFSPVINIGESLKGSFGLPISRLYAQYFKGDLRFVSMHGFGLDAFLYLNQLGNQHELLP
jgi:pyruvate dehydrogenase kinase 2/3/4